MLMELKSDSGPTNMAYSQVFMTIISTYQQNMNYTVNVNIIIIIYYGNLSSVL